MMNNEKQREKNSVPAQANIYKLVVLAIFRHQAEYLPKGSVNRLWLQGTR